MLTQTHMSGVGHNALEIIRAMERLQRPSVEIHLIVTLGKKQFLARHKFGPAIKVHVIPLPARLVEALLRAKLLLPIDLLCGKGLYIFPNYKKWPLLRSRSLLYVHDVVFMRNPEYVQPKNLHYLQKYLPVWIRAASKVVTISQFSKQEIIDCLGVPASKIVVAPCGVDQTVFYERSPHEIDAVTRRHGIAAKRYVIYVGNLEPRKNIKRVVQAMTLLPDRVKQQYALVLIGGGGWLNEGIYEAIDQARSQGAQIITPDHYVPDEDLPALLSGATALVHPAHYEGFGLSVVQAMAVGTPVLVARNSSIPELVGDAGLYVDPLSETDIAAKLQRIVTDGPLRQKLAKLGHAQADRFSWEASASTLLDVDLST
ncbi:MAG: hypothetical protein JWN38_707 [Candidatus Saccharibacteria bacterium]|nr:hypothetical protein [Candidatus Saccharibacteria bacterium]